MGIINLEDLQPDMVLRSNVNARNGRILLRAGGTITEKHLKIFHAWGVTEADIEGVSKEDVSALSSEQVDPKVYQKAEKSVRDRFCFANSNHPFSDELLRVCIFRKVHNQKAS